MRYPLPPLLEGLASTHAEGTYWYYPILNLKTFIIKSILKNETMGTHLKDNHSGILYPSTFIANHNLVVIVN